MQHIPRFFTNNKRSKAMDSKKNPRKPRLERRNAAKYIEYNANSSSSSSSIDSSPSPSLHTRSLDLSDKTSFRVEGTDGEFDRICRSLGLSGPEDFAISLAAWEARKVRSSSDLLPRSRLYPLDSPSGSKREEEEVEEEENSEVVAAELCQRVRDSAVIRDVTELTRAQPAESSGCCGADVGDACSGGGGGVAVDVVGGGGGGIKGIRPPLLKPPPSMRLPEVDLTSSTWDIFRDFAPNDRRDSPQTAIGGYASSEEEDSEKEEVEEHEEEEEQVQTEVVEDRRREEVSVVRLGVVPENAPLSETCSFTTSNDDDSSSSTTEPSNISPNGRFRRNITYWQKGELLGRGSFGSVYEGIAE